MVPYVLNTDEKVCYYRLRTEQKSKEFKFPREEVPSTPSEMIIHEDDDNSNPSTSVVNEIINNEWKFHFHGSTFKVNVEQYFRLRYNGWISDTDIHLFIELFKLHYLTPKQ